MTVNHEKFGLNEVINASGRMTILGVSTLSESVLEAQRFGGEHFFEMAELMKKTGAYLAKQLAVDDVQIVSSASAGIAQSVAAVIGQGSMYHVHHPYDETIKRREIILPKGHNVDYGVPVELMIQQGGGHVIEAGYANQCSPDHIEAMITEQTAGILYIKSHHTVQKSMLDVAEAVTVANKYELPLIVDAAAEEDLLKYTALGADLVIYSGAKAIEGPSAGMVIGKDPFVSWVRMQSQGIGRSMKIGKENVLGFVQAVDDYLIHGSESGESMKKRVQPFVEALEKLPGIKSKVVQDPAGRKIYRASIQVVTGSARTIIEQLKAKAPVIYTREYQANNGIIEFDIRSVTQKEMEQIIQRLNEILQPKE